MMVKMDVITLTHFKNASDIDIVSDSMNKNECFREKICQAVVFAW